MPLVPTLENQVPSEHVAGDKGLVVSQHPGGRREEIQGGSCWEGRQCQKTVETLLAAEQDCLGRGMEGSV